MSSFDIHQATVVDRAAANIRPSNKNSDQSKSCCHTMLAAFTTVAIQSNTIPISQYLRFIGVPFFSDCGLLVPSVDVLVTRLADHEGLAFSRRHDLYPLGLVTLAFHVQVAKRTDVVDLDVRR